MLDLTLIVVGKLRESHWKDAEREYLKRLAPYAKTRVIEVEGTPVASLADAAKSMRAEAERVLARIPEGSRVIALERTGKRMTSEAFAEMLADAAEGGARATLIIGGAAGLDATVLERADAKVSLSDMTFTHEMARVFLMEQLYRASTILAKKAYHY